MVKLGAPRPVKAAISMPARALNTIYQNNTGRPLLVVVCGTAYRANVAAAYALVNAQIDDVTPPTDVQASCGLVSEDNNPEELGWVLTIAVTPGWYYRVATSTGGAGSAVTLSQWTEIEL